MAAAPHRTEDVQQLALYEAEGRRQLPLRPATPLCAGCREKEARYGFRDGREPGLDRPRTLCFACFRMELTRRQEVAARLRRSWDGEQVALPLADGAQSESQRDQIALANILDDATRRRRRAQIAARHALGL